MSQHLVIAEMGTKCVSLEEAKTYMSIEHDEHDDVVMTLLDAAHSEVAEYCWHSLTNTRYQLILPAFPVDGAIALYRGIAQEICKVTYFDIDNVEGTIIDTDYYMTRVGLEPAVLYISDVPETYSRIDAVMVEYIAGYGDAAANVPPYFRQAILRLTHYWYDTPMDEVRRFPSDVHHFLAKYRRMRFDHPEPIL